MIAILRVCVWKLSDWNRGLSRSFLTQAISLWDTTEFKTNTVLSGIKNYIVLYYMFYLSEEQCHSLFELLTMGLGK